MKLEMKFKLDEETLKENTSGETLKENPSLSWWDEEGTEYFGVEKTDLKVLLIMAFRHAKQRDTLTAVSEAIRLIKDYSKGFLPKLKNNFYRQLIKEIKDELAWGEIVTDYNKVNIEHWEEFAKWLNDNLVEKVKIGNE